MKNIRFLAIPMIFLVIAVWVRSNTGPWYIGYKYDPDYVYLLNSLNLANLKQPGHTDHPGTLLQEVGAVAITIIHLHMNDGSLTESVIARPGYYLDNLSNILILTAAVSLYSVGLLVLKSGGKITDALIVQATPFFSPQVLPDIYRVSPEPVLFIISLWIGFFIWKQYFLRIKMTIKSVMILGFLTGAAAATKFNSVFLAIPILMITEKHKRMAYIITAVLTFIAITLPVSDKYPRIALWVWQLFIHAGNYGTGSANILKWDIFIYNIFRIALAEPYLIIVAVWGFWYLYKKQRGRIKTDKFLTALVVYLGFLVLAVAKMYYPRYLIPGAGLFGVAALIIRDISGGNYRLLGLATATVFVFNLTLIYMNTSRPNMNMLEAEKIDKLIAENKHLTVIEYYGASTPESALFFGDAFAGHNYWNEINKAYPDKSYYYLTSRDLYRNGIKEENIPSESTLWRGVPFYGVYSEDRPDLTLSDIFGGKTETIYQTSDIKTDTYE